MSDKNETIADIVADIRMQNQGLPEDSNALSPLVCDLLNLADRIEAAAKREMSKIASKNEADFGQFGNAAKLREALKKAMSFFDRGVICTSYANSASEMDELERWYDDIKTALATPPRNCDNAATWLDLYSHFHAPNGMREMPPEWVDAIAAFCQWLVATPKEGGVK